MNYKISISVFLIFAIWSCKNNTYETVVVEASPVPSALIEISELKLLLEDPNLVLIDIRKPEEYTKGHIKNAFNIWRTDLEDTASPIQGMRCSQDSLERLFGSLGIKNEHNIILYDDRGSPEATRLWWLLKLYNYNSARILNGGLSAWLAASGKLSKTVVKRPNSSFDLEPYPTEKISLDKEELVNLIQSNSSQIYILDTRTQDEYSGKIKKAGATQAGRIPNSMHIDWARSVDYHGTKKFRPIKELRIQFANVGLTPNDTIIVYCHSGVRSSHTTFVLKQLLGYKHVWNYDGSWIEWSAGEDLPFEKDSITALTK